MNEKDGFHMWTRFELECHHQAHIRCYRVWCKTNDCVGCVECGKKDRNTTNRFCNYCKSFGHPRHLCPIVEDIRINIRLNIFASGTSDKTKKYYKIKNYGITYEHRKRT